AARPSSLLLSWQSFLCSLSAHSSFCFHGPAPPEIYTLSLHDALPILVTFVPLSLTNSTRNPLAGDGIVSSVVHVSQSGHDQAGRSEEHTSELQSRENLVCRLLLEKKKITEKPANRRS